MIGIKVSFIESVDEIDASVWNSLVGRYPFLSHQFMSILERSGVTGKGTGWITQHCVVFREDKVIALMPLYEKYHSFGEYVFDQTWAEAYSRYGFDYFPKIVSSIPYTPITGPRLCLAEGENERELIDLITQEIKLRSKAQDGSSFHLLFAKSSLNTSFDGFTDFTRKAVHFQWFNRSFNSFNDFLSTFNSRKRKLVKKERKKVVDAGICFEVLSGQDITFDHWQIFYKFYVLTYAKRSGHGGYLNKSFFELLSELMADNLVLVLAKREGRYIAGALNFKDDKALYGRYWGCIEEHECLHFEACYYQGIEYCIQNGLDRFDPGVQGEHKIQRGFEPIYTYSNHWIRDDAFRLAIANAVEREGPYIEEYFDDTSTLVPFKQKE